ncbi:hypothetical protein FDP41_002835 [Naegleria fowleri]|uniref:J domain-containing protein n=1 Tax=Naegleria fowleri TaxID=5763 RepID=A0A6A5BXH7_NAEFO|nr:uncharacterized protein FDP41_002835 [Naegleria fowleri]KAF0978320.1 hypothetical protein FDP41_002835 [Naegleria fowleri]
MLCKNYTGSVLIKHVFESSSRTASSFSPLLHNNSSSFKFNFSSTNQYFQHCNLSFSFRRRKQSYEDDLTKEIKLRVASEFISSPEDAKRAFRNYALQKNKYYGPSSWYRPKEDPKQVYVPLWIFQYGDAIAYKVKLRATIDPRKQRELLTQIFGELVDVPLEKDPLVLTQNPEDFSQRDLKEKQRAQKKILKELKLDDENTLQELVNVLKNVLSNKFQIQKHNFTVENMSSTEITITCIIDHIKLAEYNQTSSNNLSSDDSSSQPVIDDITYVYASTQFERRYIKRIIERIDRKYLTDPSVISKVNYKLKWYENMWDSVKLFFSKSAFKRDYEVDYYTIDWETSWSLALDSYIPDSMQKQLYQIIERNISTSEEAILFDSPSLVIGGFDLEKTDFKLHKKDLIYFPFYVKQDVLNFPHYLKWLSPFHLKQKVQKYEHGEYTFHSFTDGITSSYVTGYVPYSFAKLFSSYFVGTYIGWHLMYLLLPITNFSNFLLYGLMFSTITSASATTEQYYKPMLHKEHHRKFAVMIHNKYIANKPLQRIYANAWKWCANPSDGNTALGIEISKGCDLYSLLELDPKKFGLYTQEEIRVQYKKMAMIYHPDLFASKQHGLISGSETSGEVEKDIENNIKPEQLDAPKKEEEEWTKEEILERFKQINYAFSILGDPYKRELYHKYGAAYFKFSM